MGRKLNIKIRIYLEIGSHRVLASALDWPGWCRTRRDADAAIRALLEYAPRYAQAVRAARPGFRPPADISEFVTVETLRGGVPTDLGVPERVPRDDLKPLKDAELHHLQALLKACWRYFDAAVEAASGRELSLGPRGGGRSLDGIVEHVLGAEMSYLSRLGGKAEQAGSQESMLVHTRETILKTLQASAHGKIAEHGPRGGKRWTARYFVRRAAWHVLDHAWEIEDRVL